VSEGSDGAGAGVDLLAEGVVEMADGDPVALVAVVIGPPAGCCVYGA
jgi:hypothetical protein